MLQPYKTVQFLNYFLLAQLYISYVFCFAMVYSMCHAHNHTYSLVLIC